jgi:hypothetical protein
MLFSSCLNFFIQGEYGISKNNLNYVCDKYIYIMVNLEWYRTFKSVYKNGNFSLAAKELFYQSASCKSADINARGTRWL